MAPAAPAAKKRVDKRLNNCYTGGRREGKRHSRDTSAKLCHKVWLFFDNLIKGDFVMVLYKKRTSSNDIESKFGTTVGPVVETKVNLEALRNAIPGIVELFVDNAERVIELERKLERLMDMQERLKSQLEDLIGMQDGLNDRQTELELEFEKFKVDLCDKDEEEDEE